MECGSLEPLFLVLCLVCKPLSLSLGLLLGLGSGSGSGPRPRAQAGAETGATLALRFGFSGLVQD